MAEKKENQKDEELELDLEDLEQVSGGSFKDNIHIKKTTDISKETQSLS